MDCSGNEHAPADVTFHMPQGPNLAGPNGRQLAAESAAAGLEALPHMAEIYPLGGQLSSVGTAKKLGMCTMSASHVADNHSSSELHCT